MSGWYDISTAPRDGTEVLVFGPRLFREYVGEDEGAFQGLAVYDEDTENDVKYEWMITLQSRGSVWIAATHWQPKPEDPA